MSHTQDTKQEAIKNMQNLNETFTSKFYDTIIRHHRYPSANNYTQSNYLPANVKVDYTYDESDGLSVRHPINNLVCEREPIIHDMLFKQCKITEDFMRSNGFMYTLKSAKIMQEPYDYYIIPGPKGYFVKQPAYTKFTCSFKLQS
jgi:hypothetical protein